MALRRSRETSDKLGVYIPGASPYGPSGPGGGEGESLVDRINRLGGNIGNLFEGGGADLGDGGKSQPPILGGRYGRAYDRTERLLKGGQEEELSLFQQAADLLDPVSTRLEALFTDRRGEVEGFDTTPFGQEEFDFQRNQIFDAINQEVTDRSRQSAINLNARGYSSGGGAQRQALGGIVGQGLQAKSGALGELFTQQRTANTRAEEFQQGLLESLTSAQAGAEERVGALKAAIMSGAAESFNPEAIAGIFEDIFAMDRSEEMGKEMLDVYQAIAEADSDLASRLWDFLPFGVQAALGSSSEDAIAAAQGFSTIFGN